MFVSGNTSPCHHSLHLFAKTDESQHAGIVQKLSDQALTSWKGPMSFRYAISNMHTQYVQTGVTRRCNAITIRFQ
ncbi:hypothetical protein FYB92_09705 [Novacetimonas sp. GS1]